MSTPSRAACTRGGATDESEPQSTSHPRSGSLIEGLVRHPGRLLSPHQLLHDVSSPEYHAGTDYLRVLMARVRHKPEEEPSRPRHFRTETAKGYHFEP